MKKQSTKHRLFALLLPLAAIGFSACTTDDEPETGVWLMTRTDGYFNTPYNIPSFLYVEPDASEMNINLHSSFTEPVIPIHMIADSLAMFDDSGKWGDAILRPGNDFDISGNPEDYPNSLDVRYNFKWIELSSYKIPDSDKGILKVRIDQNPYNIKRMVAAWLKNKQSSKIAIIQDANPEGIDPPEGDNIN